MISFLILTLLPGFRNGFPIAFDGEWIEPDRLAAVGAGNFAT